MSKEFNPFEFSDPREHRNHRVEREVVYLDEEEDPLQPPHDEEPVPHEEHDDEAEDTDADNEEDDELTPEERAERERVKAEREKRRESNPLWQFASGNWLILEGITGTYRYLLIIAVALFLSVVSIFYTFHLSQKYTRRSAEVQLLRERSLEYQRMRFNATSHTAITKELRRRNIPLYDIQESKTIIEK